MPPRNDGSGSGRPRRGSAGRSKAKSVKSPTNATAIASPIWTGGNRILASLPADESAFVRKGLTPAALKSGQILYQSRSRIESVYFPDTAVASLLSRMDNDAVVEVGTIGNEGVVGLNLFLGTDISLPETLAQIPGDAQQMSAVDFQAALEQLPRFRAIVAKCTYAFMTQVSQTAACNRLHGIDQRCARWLLLTHDRVGGPDSFPLTHQFLSFMLGVRRAGVTEALGSLNAAGLIASTNGRVTILDRAGLEMACCECYEIVRLHSGEPFEDTACA